MRARQLEFRLAEVSGKPRSDLDSRLRALREAQLVPTGGRGLHAPELEAEHVVSILLGLAGAARAADAAEAASTFSALVQHQAPGRTLAKALRDIFGNESLASDIKAVTLNRTFSTARIDFLDGQRPAQFFFPAGFDPGPNPAGAYTSGITEEGRIGGFTIHSLARDLLGANDHPSVTD